MRDAERVCETLRELGGTATRGAVWGALSEPPAGQTERREILAYASRQGWLDAAPRRLSLTPKGSARFGPQHLSRESASAAIAEPDYEPPRDLYVSILNGLPEPHANFVDVIVSQIIARYHLADLRLAEWPGNMTIGGSGTGKTTLNRLICRLFDMDIVAHTVDMTQAQTLGALRGLHVPQQGFQPSHYMSYPYLAFEEVDKDETRIKIIDAYFRGEIRQEARGKRYQVLPVPVIYANPPRKGGELIAEGEGKYALLHPAWRRRSFVLDTDYVSPDDKADVEDFAAWLDSDGNLEPGILQRQSFRVAPRLNDESKAMLRNVRELLTTDFRNRNLWPGFGPLELTALGMAALYGLDDESAAWRIGNSYLIITETIPGQVIPGALEIWKSVAGMRGRTTEEIREHIRAQIKAREAQASKTLVKPAPTADEIARAHYAFIENRTVMEDNLTKALILFDPGRFGASPYEQTISEQCNRKIRSFLKAIAGTHNAEELNPWVKIYNEELLPNLKSQADVLRKFLAQQEANQPDKIFQQIMTDLNESPENVITYTPDNPTQYQRVLDILRRTKRSYDFEYEETAAGEIEIWREEEEPEEEDAIEGEVISDTHAPSFSRLALPPARTVIDMAAISRAAEERKGRELLEAAKMEEGTYYCKFNHPFMQTRATHAIIGTHNSYGNMTSRKDMLAGRIGRPYRDPGGYYDPGVVFQEEVTYACYKHVQDAIKYIGNKGYPYYRDEEW
jgi:hypothetical protein